MKLLVLGAGGIGGYFGGRLAQAGEDVTFLVRERRRAQIGRDGLVIESPHGNAVVAAKCVTAGTLRPGYDAVFFTCKAYDLDSAMEAIAPAMKGGCSVLPMLNGLAHYERLDERFGRNTVLGGTCHINVTLRADGVVHQMDALERVFFGERDRRPSERTRALAQAFSRARVPWVLSEDIEQELWEKLIFLSAMASMTCLCRANIGEIMASPGGHEAMERALETNIAIATREGHAPRPEALEFARNRLMQPGGPQSASMLRDLEAGRPVEAEPIVGWMLDRARRHGLDDTVLSLAYTHLKAYEARRAAGRWPG